MKTDRHLFIIPRSVILRVRNVLHLRCRGNQNTRFVFNNPFLFFFFENLAVYEIMWKNIVEWGRPQAAAWRVRIA